MDFTLTAEQETLKARARELADRSSASGPCAGIPAKSIPGTT
jgi:hypothetical protein